MKTTTAIFISRADAERATADLRSIGIPDDRINLLTPGASEEDVSAVPTTETEQPGMGKAIGGVVGGAVGAAGGMHLGATVAALLLPGIGPIIAIGTLGAALLGVAGAAGGAAAGGALENSMAEGLPIDELYVYEDALRKGRSVVIAFVDDEDQAERARLVLERAGAESLDAARETWWLGLRDVEAEEYTRQGRDFRTDEPVYRRGFEAALRPQMRGKSYEEIQEHLRQHDTDIYAEEAFRRGYERGQRHYQRLRGKQKS